MYSCSGSAETYVGYSPHRGQKVIGYDASPKDRRRYAHAQGLEDPKYEYLYPLIEWGWDRERCMEEIRREGLPVPPKSACTFCPAMKPYELRCLKMRHLIEIVIMEARAAPRLRRIQGLWRNGCKGTRGAEKRPGRMTDFIRQEGLLPPDLIDHLIENAPTEIVRNQERFRTGYEIPSWHDFLESFTPEDGTAREEEDFIPLAVLDVEHMTERVLSRQDVREPSLRYAA